MSFRRPSRPTPAPDDLRAGSVTTLERGRVTIEPVNRRRSARAGLARSGPLRLATSLVRGVVKHRVPLALVAPFFILFLVFFAGPYLFALALSVLRWRGVKAPEFVGLGNFEQLLGDGRFLGALGNTAIMALIYIPAGVALAIFLAAVINQPGVRAKGMWLLMLVLPNVTAGIATTYVFKLVFNTNFGVANQLATGIGLGTIPWLEDPNLARLVVSTLVVWSELGFSTLIALAGLQTIPKELREAALCDGCTSKGAFLRITLPLMKPIIVFLVIIKILGSIELFYQPYVLTKGGPASATETVALRIFTVMFEQVNYGYAAAMGFAALMLVVGGLVLRQQVSRRYSRQALTEVSLR